MFYTLVFFDLAVVVWLAILAGHNRMALKGLALHPYNVLGALVLIFIVDFAVLYEDLRDGVATRFSNVPIDSPEQVTFAFGYLTFSLVLLAFGITLASSRPIRKGPPPVASGADRRAAWVVFAAALALVLIVTLAVVGASMARGSLLYIAGIRQLFFRENPAFVLFYAVGLPAFIYLGSRIGPGIKTLLAAVVLAALLFPLGSRTQLAIIVLALAYWSAVRIRIPTPALYLSLPVIGFGAVVYRYFAREAYRFGSFDQFLGFFGGPFNVLFRSADISMAEALTAATTSNVERTPGSTFLAMLTAPIPRALIPWKPPGASADFTMQTDPGFWLAARSERTVTGFGDLYIEFGFAFGAIVVGVIGYVWARIYMRTFGSYQNAAFVGPLTIFAAYLFVRGDLYNVALLLWPIGLVLLFAAVIRPLLGGRRAGRSAPLDRRASRVLPRSS